MELVASIAKSLGVSFAITCGVVVVFLVGSTFWVRLAVRSKVYALFLSDNKQLSGKLVKPVGNTITIGKGEDAKNFITHPAKQFWSSYPPGFPHYIQEPIPTLLYVESNAEPIDPYDRKALISPESLHRISDESMLKQTWKDVRETVGVKASTLNNKILLLMVLLAMAASAASAYMSFVTSGQLDELLKMMGG